MHLLPTASSNLTVSRSARIVQEQLQRGEGSSAVDGRIEKCGYVVSGGDPRQSHRGIGYCPSPARFQIFDLEKISSFSCRSTHPVNYYGNNKKYSISSEQGGCGDPLRGLKFTRARGRSNQLRGFSPFPTPGNSRTGVAFLSQQVYLITP